MSMASTVLGLNGWMQERGIYITDFDPLESKLYIAIVKGSKSEEEILSLARETKAMLTVARIRVGTATSTFGVKYKTITEDQLEWVRTEGIKNVKKLEGMLERGEIGFV